MPTIQSWSQTAEGVEMIDAQKVFCIEGRLWQGYQKVAFLVDESQMEDRELDAVEDIDDTMGRIWFNRKNRLGGRHDRKIVEYDGRRAELRLQGNAVLDSIERLQKAGLPPSADDKEQYSRIQARMARLVDESTAQRLAHATLREDPETAAVVAAEKKSEAVDCQHCGKVSPEGHKNPANWRRGHMMKCKARQEAAVT